MSDPHDNPIKDFKLEDDGTTGFNTFTQKLLCLIVLHDGIGAALSANAGVAFFRAFIVEDRATGEIFCNQRFRYKNGDSWMRLKLGPEIKTLSRDQQVEYCAGCIERVMRMGMEKFAGGESVPEDVVRRYYPPNPEDSESVLQYLIAEDLVEITEVVKPGSGERIRVSEGSETPQ